MSSGSARRATLRSALQHPSPQPAPQPQQQSKSKGAKRKAVEGTEDERTTTSHKQINRRFKSAKHEPAAAQTPVAQKQSQTQTQPQPRTKINGASTASTESKASGVSSSSSSSSSSPSSASHSAPCPAGFDAALWAQLTSRPSPVAIPANAIKLTYLHGLLSAVECTQLISFPVSFHRSSVGGGIGHISPLRTSSSAFVSDDTPLGRCILTRIGTLTGVSRSQIDGLGVLRYGQHFTPHYDSSLARPSPRQYTIFAYLNDVEGGGGETEFTKLGVKFKPRRGDALFWENHATRSSPHHAESEHAGRPPLSGVKYGLNCWIEFGADDPLQR